MKNVKEICDKIVASKGNSTVEKAEKADCRQDNGSALMAATPMSERLTDPWMSDGNPNERADDGSTSERTKVF